MERERAKIHVRYVDGQKACLTLFRFGNDDEDDELIGMYGTPDDKAKMVKHIS